MSDELSNRPVPPDTSNIGDDPDPEETGNSHTSAWASRGGREVAALVWSTPEHSLVATVSIESRAVCVGHPPSPFHQLRRTDGSYRWRFQASSGVREIVTKTRIAQFGDVYEISTSCGLAYIQYTHSTPADGFPLVRVLPGLYSVKPDIPSLAKRREMYFAFYVLPYAIKARQAKWVSRENIPTWARAYPVMRKRWGAGGAKGYSWLIGPASTPGTPEGLKSMRLVKELSAEEKNLSTFGILSHEGLVRQIETGWTPESDDDGPPSGQEVDSFPATGQAVVHYFYFKTRGDAEKASDRLTRRKWVTEVRLSSGQWLLSARPPVDVSTTDDELERIAEESDGEYDGSETRT